MWKVSAEPFGSGSADPLRRRSDRATSSASRRRMSRASAARKHHGLLVTRALMFGLCVAMVVLVLPLRSVGAAPEFSTRSMHVPVLVYHHVKWLKASDDAIERGLTILPTQFAAHLTYLQTHGYHTVTAARLVASLRGKGRLPSHSVVLTFDDGYRDVYANVYRVLRRRHMTATFFICPGFLNSVRYLTWRQVEDMSRHGMDIEAHTMSHPDLRIVRAAQARGEILQSRQILQTRLHRSVRVFAYPYGAYNPAILSDVSRAGYLAAFTTHVGWVETSTHMLTLPRVYANHNNIVPVIPALYNPAP
jgi:peptidoglycan/xylan/chitin deacetylase (PgdA/CDA1 family)